jgi:hypothetical protein
LGYWVNSDGRGVQDLAQEQLVRETANQVSKVHSTRLGPAESLYNKIRSELGRELDLPTIGKNLFVDLAERISKEINISNCWVCRGTLMSEQWSWKGTGLNAYQHLLWNQCN